MSSERIVSMSLEISSSSTCVIGAKEGIVISNGVVAGSAFSAETLPPFPKLEESNKEKIIKVCRERYGTSRKIIEEKIAKWVGVLETPKSSRESSPALYDAKCSLCGKDTKVIFSPESSRPVYCKSCLKKVRDNKEKPVEKKETFPTISLREAAERQPISFSPQNKKTEERKKPKAKVNVDELKEALKKALKKEE